MKWACYLEDYMVLKVSEIALDALRWKPEIRALNKSDLNSLMTDVFKTKKYATTALYAIKQILDVFTKRQIALVIHQKRTKTYNCYDTDDTVRELVAIFKQDIDDAITVIKQLSRDMSVTSTHLWSAINETAAAALRHGVKWGDYLTQNQFVNEILGRPKISTANWLMEQSMGFDEVQYRREMDRIKRLNLDHQLLRRTSEQQQSFVKNLKFSWKNASANVGKNKKSKISVNQAMKDIADIMKAKCPTLSMTKEYCAFFHHPKASCSKGDKCTRKHECPACGENHAISNCPNLQEN